MGAEGAGGLQGPGGVALQGVDPEVDGRAAGQGLALLPDPAGEDPGEGRGEPIRKVCGHGVRGAREVAGTRQPHDLRLGQLPRPMRRLCEARRDPIGRPVPEQGEDPEDGAPGAVLVHAPGGGATATQGVEDQARDEGAVPGSSIAGAVAPGLQGQSRRTASRLDLGQDADGRLDAAAVTQGRAPRPPCRGPPGRGSRPGCGPCRSRRRRSGRRGPGRRRRGTRPRG